MKYFLILDNQSAVVGSTCGKTRAAAALAFNFIQSEGERLQEVAEDIYDGYMMQHKEKIAFDEWVTSREHEILEVEKFKAIGKDKDYIFQGLAFAGDGSHKLSIATTILRDEAQVPDELKAELKNIQQQLNDFTEKLREYR